VPWSNREQRRASRPDDHDTCAEIALWRSLERVEV